MKATRARSPPVAELSGPRTTPTTTSSCSRRIETVLPVPLPCPSMTWSIRRSSASSPKTSVPLPGSIETRASGATSQMSAARSIRPRLAPHAHGPGVKTREHLHRVVERGKRGVDGAGVRVRSRRRLGQRGDAHPQTLSRALRLLRKQPPELLSCQPPLGHGNVRMPEARPRVTLRPCADLRLREVAPLRSPHLRSSQRSPRSSRSRRRRSSTPSRLPRSAAFFGADSRP